MFVYVGTSTPADQAEGIGVFRLERATGALRHVQSVGGLFRPSFVALHPHRPLLYTVERQWTADDQQVGATTAFAIDAGAGTLTQLNRVRSGGNSPCYVSVHPSGNHVFAAHYGSGHVAAFPVLDDGRVGDAANVVLHQGRGPDPRRQEGPHAHSIGPDPSGAFVLACDLGVDKVFVYRLDDAGRLVPNDVPYGQVGSGEGPRHFAFHPSGRFVYVLNEMGSTLTAFAYDAERGALTHLQTAPTLPAAYAERNSCAQVIVHPSGRFVYASNRGHDTIAVFAVDGASGRVVPVGHVPTGGKTPRNFNVDPTGTLLLAANQDSHNIVSFRIDQETGGLTPTGAVVEYPNPVCIVFRDA